MPGPPLRAFVADDDDVAGLDAAGLHRLERAFLASNTRAGPRNGSEVVARDLDDAAVGREVAAEDHQPAGRLERSSTGRTTSWPGVSTGRAASSPMVRPLTVIASRVQRAGVLAGGWRRGGCRRRDAGRSRRSGRPA